MRKGKFTKSTAVDVPWGRLAVWSIVALALFLRFVNYSNRWGLAYDQAHDVLVARHALATFQLPPLGPFSSAGPFQTVGTWYWFIMAGIALFPGIVMGPWILMTIMHVVFVYLMIRVGTLIGGKPLGLIAGLFAAVSTVQLGQATNLTNQGPLSIISLGVLWAGVRYIESRKDKYLFFLAFFASLGASIHLQGVGLAVCVVVAILLTRRISAGSVALMITGGILPFLPLILFDAGHNWVNIQNMVRYFLYDQQKISYDVLGRRWITYLTGFWPSEWAHIIGGDRKALGVVFAVGGISGIFAALRKKVTIPTRIWFILLSFLGMAAIVRYTRAPIFASYIMFLHPFIFILTGLAVLLCFRRHMALGVLALGLLVGGSLVSDYVEISKATNIQAARMNEWLYYLTDWYPSQSFAVYDHEYKRGMDSLSLVMYLDTRGLIDDQAEVNIGLVADARKVLGLVGTEKAIGTDYVYDLSSSTSAQLAATGWTRITPKEIYDSTERWMDK